jgi:hypothetical protein
MICAFIKTGALRHLLVRKVLCSILVLIFVNHPTKNVCAQTGSASSQWNIESVAAGVVDTPALYLYALEGGERYWHTEEDFLAGHLYESLHDLLVAEVAEISRELLRGLSEAELRAVAFNNNVTYYVTDFSALSDQVWAVSLETEPGGQGRFNQEIEAAYGSYTGLTAGGSAADSEYSEASNGWWFVDRQNRPLGGLLVTVDGRAVNSGGDFVGDYFTLDQFASNTGGLSRRYISISSPWSLGYIEEDVQVVGSLVVRDTFMMDNREQGWDLQHGWRELF